jgi:hypothetical protein
MNRRWLLGTVLLALLCIVLAARAGSFLIIDATQRSDVILVLAGETDKRPQRALELLAHGYARRIILNVPANAKLYEFTQLQLAQKYIQDLPQGAAISICPIAGLSTKEESKDVQRCIEHEGAKRILIVTSDFHTRRALNTFRHEIPGHTYSVAASRDDAQFGARWWTHRQWAKTFLDEWMRLIWWNLVDEWR